MEEDLKLYHYRCFEYDCLKRFVLRGNEEHRCPYCGSNHIDLIKVTRT